MKCRAAALSLAAAVAAVSCSGPDSDTSEPIAVESTKIDLPDGVKLTKPGTTLKVRRRATFTVSTGQTASVMTAQIASAKRGKIRDLRYFTLDSAAQKATPYYVTASVQNRGPAGLGGIAPPFVVVTTEEAVVPPSRLNGDFKPCSPRELPATLLPGTSARLCMVFLVPRGSKIATIDALSNGAGKPVRWKP